MITDSGRLSRTALEQQRALLVEIAAVAEARQGISHAQCMQPLGVPLYLLSRIPQWLVSGGQRAAALIEFIRELTDFVVRAHDHRWP